MAESDSNNREVPRRFAHITAAELDDLLGIENSEFIESTENQHNPIMIASEDARPIARPAQRIERPSWIEDATTPSCSGVTIPPAGCRPSFPSEGVSRSSTRQPVDNSTPMLFDKVQQNQRFPPIGDSELKELLEPSDSINTRKQIKYAVTILSKYAASIGSSFADIESLSAKGTDAFLAKFYAAIRRHDGSLYTQKSMHGIKFGLQRHYQEVHGWDIVRDKEFKKSKKVFKAINLKLKQAGLGIVRRKTYVIINDLDLMKIKTSLNTNTPLGLQNKVFVDISMNLAIRGRHNFRSMKKGDFTVRMDKSGLKYITHKGQVNNKNVSDVSEERLYEEPGNPQCPIKTFLKYSSKLHPNCLSFWQTPKKLPAEGDEPWYSAFAIGKNSISGKTRQISIAAGCSRIYSNLCLHATGVKWKLQKRSSLQVGSAMQIFNQSSSNSMGTLSDIQIKEEAMNPETPMGYLRQSVSNISTKPDPDGESYIGHAVILEDQGLPEDGYQSNSESDMSSVVIVEEDDDDDENDNDPYINNHEAVKNDSFENMDQQDLQQIFGDGRKGVNETCTNVDIQQKVGNKVHTQEVSINKRPGNRGIDVYQGREDRRQGHFVKGVGNTQIVHLKRVDGLGASSVQQGLGARNLGDTNEGLQNRPEGILNEPNPRDIGKGFSSNTSCSYVNVNTESDEEVTTEERVENGLKTPYKRLTERHFIAVNKGRTPLGQPCKPQCVVCSDPAVKRHRTEYICEQCVLPMCPAPCFKRYHTMADYKSACSETYHNT